jgi:ribosomal protein S18 acetylase RimI-like enzyme
MASSRTFLMKFSIGNQDNLNISNSELSELLSEVYVQSGFTPSDVATIVFNPVKVRSRGTLFAAREMSTNEFSGMVIVVPSGSSATVRAKENECEIHLLGVAKKFRGRGLGRSLVKQALDFAQDQGCSKVILWTQKPMKEAQKLYESFGFNRTCEMFRSGIEFLVYEKELI